MVVMVAVIDDHGGGYGDNHDSCGGNDHDSGGCGVNHGSCGRNDHDGGGHGDDRSEIF